MKLLRPLAPIIFILNYLSWLLVGIFLSSCGTLTSRMQIVSVDSEVRGTEFFDEDQKTLGRTPRFVLVERQSSLTFHLRDKPNTSFQCKVRWGASIGGNTLGGYAFGSIFAVTPQAQIGVAVTGVLLDKWFGGLYYCPEMINLNVAQSRSTELHAPEDDKSYCRNFLIAPVEHVNGVASSQIKERWVNFVTPRLKGCDRIVSLEVAQGVWDILDFSHVSPPNPRRFADYDKLSRIGLETNATHLVVLRTHSFGSAIRVLPQVYDLHKRIPSARLTKEAKAVDAVEAAFVINDEEIATSDQRWIISWFASHSPNAVEFSPAFSTSLVNRNETKGKVIHRSLRRRPRLPSYATSWQLSTSPSPAVYPKWGVDVELHPSISTSYFNNAYVYSPEQLPGLNVNYSIETGYAAMVMKAVVLAYTPVGGFSFFIGAGPVFGAVNEDEKGWRGFASTLGGVGFEYNLPVSDRWYFFSRAEGYALNSAVTKSEMFSLGGWSTISLGFGYFAPEIRRAMMQWVL